MSQHAQGDVIKFRSQKGMGMEKKSQHSLQQKQRGAVVKQPPSFERKLNEKLPKKSKNVTAAPHLIF